MRSVHSDRMGWGLSHERSNFAEAETLGTVEGNMCGIAMRDAVAPPGVEGHITSERNASEPERSHVRPQAAEPTGPHREGEKPKPMMHGHEKSDSAIVAMKPPNKAGRPGSGGGGAKGGGQGEREPMPHVPDTVPGKRVTDAGARTEGRGQPSNIRGRSRMQESCPYGSVRGAPSNGCPYRNRQIGSGSAPVRPMVWARPVRPKDDPRELLISGVRQIINSRATPRTSISKSSPCTGGRAKCHVKPPEMA